MVAIIGAALFCNSNSWLRLGVFQGVYQNAKPTNRKKGPMFECVDILGDGRLPLAMSRWLLFEQEKGRWRRECWIGLSAFVCVSLR